MKRLILTIACVALYATSGFYAKIFKQEVRLSAINDSKYPVTVKIWTDNAKDPLIFEMPARSLRPFTKEQLEALEIQIGQSDRFGRIYVGYLETIKGKKNNENRTMCRKQV